ncbi:hypothetical protein CDL15_Pgr019594 [Punica granatum]|uniref:NB-ARC domain-containing protein n=1 Tax=Punica granatum TaxID=22663 RepID=A0A218X5V4_PUNGR|nr:hypothetical protein CDL15_Pgr019594 [Punica granatum]
MRKIARESTPGREHRDLKGAELTKELGEELDGKKFLFVLDDVWNDNWSKWLDLEGSLMNGAKGSKILVTTRHLSVAKTMTPTCHELRGLPEDPSLDLLMRMARKQEYEWKTQNLEEIAKEILKKCGGVPLAIGRLGYCWGWEGRRSRRRSSRIKEEVEEEDDSLLMLPVFSDKVEVYPSGCPTFSYMHGQELHLRKTSTRIIKQFLRNVTIRHASASSSSSSSSRMMVTLISPSSISLLALTCLTISEVEDSEHLLVELLKSLPSL